MKKLRARACFTKTPPELSSTHTPLMGADWISCWVPTTFLTWFPRVATKTAWTFRCHGFAIMTATPKRRQWRKKKLHPAAGMRATDERIKLLHRDHRRGTQYLDQDGGWQSPSVIRQAAGVCAGKVFAADAYSGVIAKMSGLLRCLCGSGNGNLCIHDGSVTSEESAYRDMRSIPRLDPGQCLTLRAEEAAAPAVATLGPEIVVYKWFTG